MSYDDGTATELQPYIAANGHKMIQVTPGQWWNAHCTDDCRACQDGDIDRIGEKCQR